MLLAGCLLPLAVVLCFLGFDGGREPVHLLSRLSVLWRRTERFTARWTVVAGCIGGGRLFGRVVGRGARRPLGWRLTR